MASESHCKAPKNDKCMGVPINESYTQQTQNTLNYKLFVTVSVCYRGMTCTHTEKQTYHTQSTKAAHALN